NTSNIYVSQWLLGRYEMLLKDPGDANSYRSPQFASNNEPYYPRVPNLPPDLTPLAAVDGLGREVQPTSGNQRPINTVGSSRYDLAGTTLEIFREDATNRRNTAAFNPALNVNFRDGINSSWWIPIVYRTSYDPRNSYPNGLLTPSLVFRHQANPLPG